MNQQISLAALKNVLLGLLAEIFEPRDSQIVLDAQTSLFETLETISAAEASVSIAKNAASIAAHVEHTGFYLDVLGETMRTQTIKEVDWREIWERVGAVTPAEWEASKRNLRESYSRVVNTIEICDGWENELTFAAALGVLAHTAYHLGAIRQAMTAIKSAGK